MSLVYSINFIEFIISQQGQDMKIRLFTATALLTICSLLSFSVGAAKDSADLSSSKQGQAVSKNDNKNTSSNDPEDIADPVARAKAEALNEKMVRILTKLDTQQAQHFMIIIANYNIIGTVKAVEEDVQNAAHACSENNSSMADTISTRFGEWKKAISSHMVEAEANVQNMVIAQDYAPKAEFDNIFSMIEDVRAYNSSRFEKTPVTTPAGCEFMLSKLEETQKNMISLLSATLASFPTAREKSQE